MPTAPEQKNRLGECSGMTPEGREVAYDALGQGVVTAIIRAALDALLPEPLDNVLVREQWEREDALALLNGRR
jgi:hypothetical protein